MSTHRPLSRALARRGLATKLTLSLAVAATALPAQETPVRFPPVKAGAALAPASAGVSGKSPQLAPTPELLPAFPAIESGGGGRSATDPASSFQRPLFGLARDEAAITPPGQPLTRLPMTAADPLLLPPDNEVEMSDVADEAQSVYGDSPPPHESAARGPTWPRPAPADTHAPLALDPQDRPSVSVLVQPAPRLERGVERPAEATAGVEARSREHVREGLELAERGAIFSARNRFLRALSILAQARDMAGGGCLHTQMLSDARTALQEAEDFAATGNRLPNEIRVKHLARVHRSRILQQPNDDMTPWAARREYQEYARQQLAGAVGASPSASLALYGMGKTIALQAEEGPDAELRYLPQAITMHQAALDADPDNFLAANELGVLFARSQRWRDAQRMFQFAVEKKNAAQIWDNLAKTHEQLGESRLAEAARSYAVAARQTPQPQPSSDLQWTTPEHFAATQAGGPAGHLAPTMAASPQAFDRRSAAAAHRVGQPRPLPVVRVAKLAALDEPIDRASEDRFHRRSALPDQRAPLVEKGTLMRRQTPVPPPVVALILAALACSMSVAPTAAQAPTPRAPSTLPSYPIPMNSPPLRLAQAPQRSLPINFQDGALRPAAPSPPLAPAVGDRTPFSNPYPAAPTYPVGQGQQPRAMCAVDSAYPSATGEPRWDDARLMPFQGYGPGEYTGPARHRHVDNYRIRVNDQLDLIYRRTRVESVEPYELNVGDEMRIESIIDPGTINRNVTILGDGTVNLALIGAFRAARMTLPQLEQELNRLYLEFVPDAQITITPIKVNTRLDDILNTVDSRFGSGGTLRAATVSVDGTIQLAGLGSVPAQGLTKTELQNEVNARYAEVVQGLEITVAITAFAPTSVYVLGEVATPGRYPLQGPTTVMQAIALAGGWNIGGNLRQIVVFRRTEDWRLVATRLDLRGALLGKRPTPADELWVRDSDIILVPKNPLRRVDDAINLVFTQGLYGILPNEQFGFFRLSRL